MKTTDRCVATVQRRHYCERWRFFARSGMLVPEKHGFSQILISQFTLFVAPTTPCQHHQLASNISLLFSSLPVKLKMNLFHATQFASHSVSTQKKRFIGQWFRAVCLFQHRRYSGDKTCYLMRPKSRSFGKNTFFHKIRKHTSWAIICATIMRCTRN